MPVRRGQGARHPAPAVRADQEIPGLEPPVPLRQLSLRDGESGGIMSGPHGLTKPGFAGALHRLRDIVAVRALFLHDVWMPLFHAECSDRTEGVGRHHN